jgi:hypothetical protein
MGCSNQHLSISIYTTGSPMKLSIILTVNAILWVALGIAFALYGPMMLNFFAVPELQITPEAYWQIAAFARMFGAVLFGLGLLVWAVSRGIEEMPVERRRSILFSLVLGNLMAAFVSTVEQVSIWGTSAGWVMAAIFAFFTLAYGYWITRM